MYVPEKIACTQKDQRFRIALSTFVFVTVYEIDEKQNKLVEIG